MKKLETQIQLLQIENTELGERNQLADNQTRQLQEKYDQVDQEQKSLTSQLTTVSFILSSLSLIYSYTRCVIPDNDASIKCSKFYEE